MEVVFLKPLLFEGAIKLKIFNGIYFEFILEISSFVNNLIHHIQGKSGQTTKENKDNFGYFWEIVLLCLICLLLVTFIYQINSYMFLIKIHSFDIQNSSIKFALLQLKRHLRGISTFTRLLYDYQNVIK